MTSANPTRQFLVTMQVPGAPGSYVRVWNADHPIFLSSSNRWLLEKTGDGFRVRDLDLPAGASSIHGFNQWSVEETLSGKRLPLPDGLDRAEVQGWIRIAPIHRPGPGFLVVADLAAVRASAKATALALRKTKVALGPETRRFLKIAGAIIATFIVVIAIASLIPQKAKDPDQELVPEEFAKVILTPQDVKEPSPEQINDSATTAAESAVAQAFQAQAIQSAVSNLIKGGMTKLMANMDVASQKTSGKLFVSENGQGTLNPGGKIPGLTGLKGGPNVKVSGMGGGVGGAGYGTSGKTGVAGQGGGFVSLDGGGASVAQGLTQDQVGKVIHEHMSEIRYCYESAMLRNPDLEGKMLVAFIIGKNGRIKTSNVKNSSVADPRFEDCILRRLVTWLFPKPAGAIDVSVTYPFIFKPVGR